MATSLLHIKCSVNACWTNKEIRWSKSKEDDIQILKTSFFTPSSNVGSLDFTAIDILGGIILCCMLQGVQQHCRMFTQWISIAFALPPPAKLWQSKVSPDIARYPLGAECPCLKITILRWCDDYLTTNSQLNVFLSTKCLYFFLYTVVSQGSQRLRLTTSEESVTSFCWCFSHIKSIVKSWRFYAPVARQKYRTPS